MATTTTTAGMALGNIPLSTMMVDKEAVVDIVSGEAEEILSGVQEIVDTAVSTAWKAGGSAEAADITAPGAFPGTRALLIKENEGKVYNMSTSGTTDEFFVEGSGKPYTAGTDIAVINTGTTSSPVYKFNVLAVQDGSVVKSVNNISPVNGNVTIPNAGASTNGLMTSGQYTKLSGIAPGAEVNQNAFAKIAVSGVAGTGDAASKTDTLTLVPGDNVTISRNGKSVTIGANVPSGVVTSIRVPSKSGYGQQEDISPDENGVADLLDKVVSVFVTDSGSAYASIGYVDIHGHNGVTVTRDASGSDAIIVDASDVSGIASGAQSGVIALSGVVSGLKNFSGVDVYATSGATAKTSVTAGSNAATLQIKAGNNVTLSGDNTNKAVTINASVPVKDGKISGGSSLLSGTTIVIPVASTSAQGVTQLTDSVSNSTTTAITPNAVSGAISGVNSGLATKITGSTLHNSLVNSGLSNGVGSGNNTIYALINALHASDNTSEGHPVPD